jgi:radical SAM protein with 4Fe4S-binding SPASM domain
MCDVWRRPASEELEPCEYRKLPNSLVYINVSGGEPFLRKDLVEIVEALRYACPKAEICISTNGILTDRIQDQMLRIIEIDPSVRIMISVDGVGDVHDNIRGVKGAFDAAIASLTSLKEMGVKKLGVASIAANCNLGKIGSVMQLAKKMKIDFTFNGVPNRSDLTLLSERYTFNDLDLLKDQIDDIVDAFLRSFVPRNWVRAYVNSGTFDYVLSGKRRIPCFAGTDFFFMAPNGDIYPDMVLGYKLGNIKKQSFEQIWMSERAEAFRRKINDVSNCETQCWMLCTVWPHMRRNKLNVMKWVAINKLKAHLGIRASPIQV